MLRGRSHGPQTQGGQLPSANPSAPLSTSLPDETHESNGRRQPTKSRTQGWEALPPATSPVTVMLIREEGSARVSTQGPVHGPLPVT